MNTKQKILWSFIKFSQHIFFNKMYEDQFEKLYVDIGV